MKPILIDELFVQDHPSSSFTIEEDGAIMDGWQISKPLNYDPKYLSKKDRKEMADAVLAGKAIAICYFEDLSDEEQLEYVKAQMDK